VRAKAAAGETVRKRDYALLLFYLVTGMRRREVISLRGGYIRIDEYITLTGKVKGSDYVGREVRDPLLREALLDYLSSCDREGVLKTDGPLWTRHSFARIVAGETGSITDTQDALGHRNAATTRVYGQRIAVKRDKHSGTVTSRLRRH
jgi:integrase